MFESCRAHLSTKRVSVRSGPDLMVGRLLVDATYMRLLPMSHPPQMIRRRARSDVTRSRFTGRGWVAGAVLVVVLGAVGSFLAARAVAHSDKQKSQRALAATSADVTARLRLAIQHEEDLVVSTSAFIVSNPRISNAKFNEWVRADRVVERYPEILGLGRIVIVPRSQLASYGARAVKDPAGPLGGRRILPGHTVGQAAVLLLHRPRGQIAGSHGHPRRSRRMCRHREQDRAVSRSRSRRLRARSTRNGQSTGSSNTALSGRPRSANRRRTSCCVHRLDRHRTHTEGGHARGTRGAPGYGIDASLCPGCLARRVQRRQGASGRAEPHCRPPQRLDCSSRSSCRRWRSFLQLACAHVSCWEGSRLSVLVGLLGVVLRNRTHASPPPGERADDRATRSGRRAARDRR